MSHRIHPTRSPRSFIAASGLLTALLLGCGAEGTTGPEGMSPVARAYLESALDTMQAHSVRRYEIDWPQLREQTRSRAGSAQTRVETHPAIRFALEELGDRHSFLLVDALQAFRAGPGYEWLLAPPAPVVIPPVRRLNGAIGFVPIASTNETGIEANNVATEYHRAIESLDAQGACGWVVDLRGNTGGYFWTMLAGAGPIVGDGVLGYFVEPDSQTRSWGYENGSSRMDGTTMVHPSQPYELRAADPPVAVLTDGNTRSSAEGIAIAFRDRSSSRSFGSPTYGVPSANRGFHLSDGAVLVLSVAWMADRTGHLYQEQIVPDELVDGSKTANPETDAPLAAALEWLLAQPACADG